LSLQVRRFLANFLCQIKTDRFRIPGGYDPRVSENVQYHNELLALAASLGLGSSTAHTIITALAAPPTIPVLFLLSVPTTLKDALLRSARVLVYTPSNEHFGIVPLEAMREGVPVLAANTGGPRESVQDGVTGWLCDAADVAAWTKVMDRALNDMSAAERDKMAKAGRSRVKNHFGRPRMAEKVERILDDMDKLLVRPPLINSVLNFAGIAAVFLAGTWVSRMYGKARQMHAH
jgi:alpha-1,3/alpha-1,6-mannosyltransferase